MSKHGGSKGSNEAVGASGSPLCNLEGGQCARELGQDAPTERLEVFRRASDAVGGAGARTHRSPPTRLRRQLSCERTRSRPGPGWRWRRERAPPAASGGHAAMAREVTRTTKRDPRVVAYVTAPRPPRCRGLHGLRVAVPVLVLPYSATNLPRASSVFRQ